MIDTNLDFLIREYKERIGMLQTAVSAGNCQTYDEYRYSCGQIRGLESACLIISDLKHRMENSDE
jgi:hypothetical protein